MTQLPDLNQPIDVRRISARLNRALQPQGINVAVVFQGKQLQISLESLDAPDWHHLAYQVLAIINALRIPVQAVELQGYLKRESAAVWQQAFYQANGKFVAPRTQQSPKVRSPQLQAPHLQPSPRHEPRSDSATTPDRTSPRTHLPNFESYPATQSSKSSQPLDDRAVPHPTSLKQSGSNAVPVTHKAIDEAGLIAAAKQGHIPSIQALVGHYLKRYPGANLRIELRQGVLKLIIESQQYLGGPAFAKKLAMQLNPISSNRVQTLEIYRRKSPHASPFLMQKVSLPIVPITSGVKRHRPVTSPTCPIGVQFIALIYAGVGLINLLIAGAMAVILGSAIFSMETVGMSAMLPYVAIVFLMSFGIALCAMAIAIGLRKLKRWSLLLSYLLAGFMIFRGGQFLLDIWGTQAIIVNIEIGLMVVAASMLFYLSRDRISRLFR